VAISAETIEVAGGRLPIRVHRPGGSAPVRPVVVHFHGGGFAMGNLPMGDWICSRLAAGADVVVVSVGYRLAPAHPFPAAVDDCWAALQQIHDDPSRFGVDPSAITVFGESAGGNLAAVMCLLARDSGIDLIRRQILMYPALDLTGASPSLQRLGDQPFVRLAQLEAFVGHYLGADRTAATDWRVSPLHAPDLRGLPPALILVGEFDPLHDDGVRYAEALRAAGVSVQLREYPGMPHGFVNFPNVCRSARPAMDDVVAFQRG
jgi:acetyl esterase